MTQRPPLRIELRARALSGFVYRATASAAWRTGNAHYQRQLRSSVAAIAATIAEGRGQPSAANFARFLSMAIASGQEAESHLTEIEELGLMPTAMAVHIRSEIQQVRAMTISLRTHLWSRSRKQRKRGKEAKQ